MSGLAHGTEKSEIATRLAVRLFEKMEQLDPSGPPSVTWSELSDDEKGFCILLVEDLLANMH
jgi:hypothetical protein